MTESEAMYHLLWSGITKLNDQVQKFLWNRKDSIVFVDTKTGNSFKFAGYCMNRTDGDTVTAFVEEVRRDG